MIELPINKKEAHEPYKLKVLELFGGIGAPRMALRNLWGECKVKSVDYVDILNWATYAYDKLFKTCHLPQSVTEWNIDVDILIHGSPCQDFSQAGKGLGGKKETNTRSSLLWETIDIVKNRVNKKPKVIIWENVKAVLNKNHRPTFDAYLEELKKLGYVNKWEVLNSKDFGIPQSRNRVFVVSVLESEMETFGHFEFDKLKKSTMRPLKDILQPHEECQDYILTQKSMATAVKEGKIKIIDNIAQTVTTKQWRWNNAGVVKIPLYNFNAENYVHNSEDPNMATCTLTAGGAQSRIKIAYPANENNKEAIVFIIDGKPYNLRILTPKECWQLMGFTKEDYKTIEELPKTAKYHLAGNSIVVQVMEAIFKELLWGKK